MRKLWNRLDRVLDKLTFGPPFRGKVNYTPLPHFCPPEGTLRLRRGLAAFDADREELEQWSFILEAPFCCCRLAIKDVEILIDQIKFTLKPLTPRYRLDCTKLKLHTFDANGQIFAINSFDVGRIGRSYTLNLIYTIKA